MFLDFTWKPLKLRCCKSYLFIKLMLFSWPSLNPSHIGVIRISKWRLLEVETKNTIFVPFKTEWVFDPNVNINLALEIYTKLSLIWYIGLCIWTNENECERPPNNVERSRRRDNDRWGEFILVYCFDTEVGVSEPNYSDVCLSLLHASFQEKIVFLTNGMQFNC